MSLFDPGRKKTGGRAKGARNKLSVAFLEAFAADFEEHGAEVITIVRVEKPHEYLKTAAYLMPKEFEITENHLRAGVNMLHQHAQFGDGSVSVEAGLIKMLTMMEGGRFKVFKHLNDWWEEFRLYHRKDGKVVKEGDDLMAATRYAIMMLRFASTKALYDRFRRPIEYPKMRYF
jgi:hypothetical protein